MRETNKQTNTKYKNETVFNIPASQMSIDDGDKNNNNNKNLSYQL
jgi:hypothetical protein